MHQKVEGLYHPPFLKTNILFGNDPDPAPFFVDDRHRLIAVGAFDIDEIIEKADAVMIHQKIELLFTGGTGRKVSL